MARTKRTPNADKGQMNIRVSDDTRRQISRLMEQHGDTQANVISKAIDRMYREEIRTMGTTTITNPEMTETDYDTRWYLPVTLRQVEAAGIELEGGFGIDADEHEALLDEPNMLRLVVAVEADEDTYTTDEITRIECYQSNRLAPPAWEDCCRIYRMPEGHKQAAAWRANIRRCATLAAQVWPDMATVVEAKREEWENSLRELEQTIAEECPELNDD